MGTTAGAADFPFDEYESRVRDYISSVENLAVDFVITDESLDRRVSFRDECSLISIAGHFRVKVVTTEKDAKGTTTHTRWHLLRPDGYYVISEKAPGRFLLKERNKDVTSPLFVDANTPLSFLMHPVSNVNSPLIRLLRGEVSKTRMLKATSFVRGQGRYTLQAVGEDKGVKSQSTFELNDRWLLTRATTNWRDGRLLTEIAYVNVGSRLLPSRVSVKVGTAATMGSNHPGHVTQFGEYREYSGTPEDFSLRQFGLPEPTDSSPIYQGGSLSYLWFIGIGVLCLGAGLYLRRRVRRRTMPSVEAIAKSSHGNTQ
jgi:hypothetical protein